MIEGFSRDRADHITLGLDSETQIEYLCIVDRPSANRPETLPTLDTNGQGEILLMSEEAFHFNHDGKSVTIAVTSEGKNRLPELLAAIHAGLVRDAQTGDREIIGER